MRTLPAAPQSYVLCTAPRSGSTMLCGMLAATGEAGDPQSYFHRPDVAEWASGLDLPAIAPLDRILRAVRKTATKGLCGIRLQRDSADFLMRTLAPFGATDTDRINAAFGPTVFLWLKRADKLAQAISVLRAQATGLWHRQANGNDLERLPPTAIDAFDAQAIASQIKSFEAADKAWHNWFSANDIAPLTLTYEDLAAAPEAQLARVLSYLGRDPTYAKDIPIPTAKLADDISAKWTQMYLASCSESD